MKKAYCLMNHPLTPKQEKELIKRYNTKIIIYPEKELSAKWSQVPVTTELDLSIIKDVVSWLSESAEGDVLIVQGEAGSTFMIADYALKHHLVPLYAVTKRVETEEIEGETVKRHYVFEHVCFRSYEHYDMLADFTLTAPKSPL